MNHTKASLIFDEEKNQYACQGAWTVLGLDGVLSQYQQLLGRGEAIAVDGSGLEALDSAGALALIEWTDYLKRQGKKVDFIGFSATRTRMLELVKSKAANIDYQVPEPVSEGFLYELGAESVAKLHQLDGLVILVGDLSAKIFEAFSQWKRFQFPSIVSIIYSAGIQALPIVGLLSFLIGVVLAYQMGLQLQTYGANIFIAYLTGIAIFREFGPLITAIIVAGRTSSAFTAQLGSMKINEEIDALLTMGLSPTELLVMPKVIGMLFVFPLLIFWSDVFSVLGSMIMSKSMLSINFDDFLLRLKDSVGLKHMMLGLYKAPTFAILIALVGCFQGFRVESNADSIGAQTTKSVVQALFLIIVADAVYSIIYSWMDL